MTTVVPQGTEAPAPIIDDRPRSRRLLPPLVTGVGVLLATAFIRFVDPNVPGHYPVCPTKLFLGIDCPGCGGLRATHDLACGNVAGALDNNALFVVLVPFLVGAWFVWVYRAWTGRTPPPTPRRQWWLKNLPWMVLAVSAAFMVIRNFVPYLGSGVG